VIEVLDVRRFPLDRSLVAAAAVDTPVPGLHSDGHVLDIRGWVVGIRGRAETIEVIGDHGLIRSAPVRVPRRDVADRFRQVEGADTCGFRTAVGLAGLGGTFRLEIRALFADGTRVPIATIVGTRTSVSVDSSNLLQPIILTSLGRTGTTWLMRLMLEHPQMVVHPAHPHEVHAAAYWAHMFKVLSEPADHLHSAHPDAFRTRMSHVGHHPFSGPPVTAEPAMADWFGVDYPDRLAAFSTQAIDSFYRRLAKTQGKKPRYFAEKFQPDLIPALMWELYPNGREVVLVRDFRDVVCSVLAFNRKRGFADFGRESAASDEDYVRAFASHCRWLLEAYRSRADRAFLLRYEDLIIRPEETLRELLVHLDLPSDDRLVAGMLDRASTVGGPLADHRTTDHAKRSVGRWVLDMDPSLQQACEESLSQVLLDFGYDASRSEMAHG
jgi:sulfotransferase family protein